MLLFKGGKDMKTLFKHVGKVLDSDSYAQSVKKVSDGLSARTNKVVQRNKLFSNFPQGSKSFEKWSVEISNAAELIDYSDYSWQQAAVDAMVLQTSNAKLRERALQDNVNYDTLMTLGVAKEQSVRGAAAMEKASGQSSQTDMSKVKIEQEVRRLREENSKLKGKKPCNRCGKHQCGGGTKCAANGQKCGKCHKLNHFAKVCFSDKKKQTGVGQLSSAEDSDSSESSGRVVVGKVGSSNIGANMYVSDLDQQFY